VSVELILGDCLDVLPTLETESVHLVVTSPPYGDMYSAMSVGECKALIQGAIGQCERILTPGGKLVLNVNNYVTSKANGWEQRQIIPMTQWIQEACTLIYQDEIFWYKKLAQGRSRPLFGSYPYPPNFLMCQRIEYVLVWAKEGKRQVDQKTKDASRLTKEEWREWTQNLWSIMDSNYDPEHPAPFPYELPMRIICLYSFSGDTVLDFCMGTGTTGQVCVHKGRNFVGCEIDPGYFEIAKARIEAAQTEMVQARMAV